MFRESIEDIDDFAMVCGYFCTKDWDVNNGYNCDNPDNELFDDKKGR